MKPAQELLTSAIEREGAAQRALMAGDPDGAREAFHAAADLYARSWEQAPPRSYGRLVGMLKATVLSGEDARQRAEYVRAALAGDPAAPGSRTASYALALAALIAGDDEGARQRTVAMRGGSEAFDRTATAIATLAAGDRHGYRAAVTEIVNDFEQRSSHLTGVAIADTALVLEHLAAPRGMAAEVRSEVLPGA